MTLRLLLPSLLLFAAGVRADTSLWKIDNAPVYLAGSCHVLRASDYPLPPEMMEAFKVSDEVWFETDIDALDTPKVQQKIIQMGSLPKGHTLKKELSKENYEAFAAHVQQIGVPIQVLEPFKPYFATMTVSMVEMQKMGVDLSRGLDRYFRRLARQTGKKAKQLETVDEQLKAINSFNSVPPDDVIRNYLEESGELQKDIPKMLDAWKAGNEEEIDEVFLQRMREEYPEIHKILLIDRNRSWIPKIEEIIKSGKPTMIVVGVGHLAGPENVRELLAANGYTSAKVKTAVVAETR